MHPSSKKPLERQISDVAALAKREGITRACAWHRLRRGKWGTHRGRPSREMLAARHEATRLAVSR
jgi:hypothetical protein